MKRQFCPYCGTKLDEGALFCKNCGEPISGDGHDSGESPRPSRDNPTERKVVYEGNIHKCPNCGEVMESFMTVCPSCGYEVRDVSAPSSVRELAMKLESISAQKMPAIPEKKSVMKMVFGSDFREGDEAEEALRRFENQKDQEKASLISNYPVPNSKEDIIEFMILASSNIDLKKGISDIVSKAWISKLDQVYQRAEITMGDQPDFQQIKSIYDKKKKDLKNKKIKGVLIGIGGVAAYCFFFGILINPTVTISITIGVLVLLIVGLILYKKKK